MKNARTGRALSHGTCLAVLVLVISSVDAFAYDADKLGFAAAEYIGSAYGLDALKETECGYLFKKREDPWLAVIEVKRSLSLADQKEIEGFVKGKVLMKSVNEGMLFFDELRLTHKKQGLDLPSSCEVLFRDFSNFYISKKTMWRATAKRYGN